MTLGEFNRGLRNPLLVNCAILLSQQPFLFMHAAPDDVKLAVTISWNLQQIRDLITIKKKNNNNNNNNNDDDENKETTTQNISFIVMHRY